MIRQLFLDLDGVLSDFDGYYEQQFGVRPNQDTYEPPDMWDNIRKHGYFYRDQPMMPDAMDLWLGAKKLHQNPIILSGIPHSIPNVADHKRNWVDYHLGYSVELICCASASKARFGHRGDILVDDRNKYRSIWEGMGGVWVLHQSAKQSLAELENLLKPA